MKTVLFLGAGATRAQWDWEKKHGTFYVIPGSDYDPPVSPPLSKDFICCANIWDSEGDRCHVGIRKGN